MFPLRLKSELLEKGNGSPHLLQAAIHQSNDITKKRFHKPVVREDSHMGLVRKAKANLNSRQMWAARELYKWRDRVGFNILMMQCLQLFKVGSFLKKDGHFLSKHRHRRNVTSLHFFDYYNIHHYITFISR